MHEAVGAKDTSQGQEAVQTRPGMAGRSQRGRRVEGTCGARMCGSCEVTVAAASGAGRFCTSLM